MLRQQFLLSVMLAGLIAVSGCEQRKPRLTDGQIQEIRSNLPGVTDTCLEKIRYGGIEAMPDDTDQCFEMMPQKQWSGLWAQGFELSRFCPSPASSCAYDTPGDNIWLTLRATFSKTADTTGDISSIRVFKIRFLGRQTRERGGYGHLGQSTNEIIVDRVISASEVHSAGTAH